jgi:hypothetical protein
LRLRTLPPAWKQHIVFGMWECLLFDRVVKPEEAEGARAIGAVLGVPIPPVIATDATIPEVTQIATGSRQYVH